MVLNSDFNGFMEIDEATNILLISVDSINYIVWVVDITWIPWHRGFGESGIIKEVRYFQYLEFWDTYLAV